MLKFSNWTTSSNHWFDILKSKNSTTFTKEKIVYGTIKLKKLSDTVFIVWEWVGARAITASFEMRSIRFKSQVTYKISQLDQILYLKHNSFLQAGASSSNPWNHHKLLNCKNCIKYYIKTNPLLQRGALDSNSRKQG